MKKIRFYFMLLFSFCSLSLFSSHMVFALDNQSGTAGESHAIYRLYNYENGEHLYTIDANEKDVLYQQHHWGYEGVAWYAPSSGNAVYRLYNHGLQNHLYTMDLNEVRVLTTYHGWQLDNAGNPVFYSGGSTPIYRVYNPALRGLHHWTTDFNEYSILPNHGWKQEGEAFFAESLGNPMQTQYVSNVLYNGYYYYVRGKYGYVPIVNKKYPVNSQYSPGENAEAKAAFLTLTNQMRQLGFSISHSYSGFRSYSLQDSLYNNYVAQEGRVAADRYSARPGYSEHQTGLAFDILNGQGELLQGEAAQWLAKHAHEYGFIIRYLPGKEAITGYMHEEWHVRYVGQEAADIYHSGLTLEEYFEIAGGDYQ